MNVTIDKHSGFCFGVEFAIQMAEDEMENDKTLYCLGDIVHNDMEVKRLYDKGLRIITREDLKDLYNCKVLIRAHGEPPETYKIALENNRNADGPATGTVEVRGLVRGIEVVQFVGDIVELKPNGKARFNWKHTAVLADASVLETIEWTATVTVKNSVGDPEVVDDASGETIVTVKNNGKNSK